MNKLYELAEPQIVRVAKSVVRKWKNMEYDDLHQELWLAVLSDKNLRGKIMDGKDVGGLLTNKANSICSQDSLSLDRLNANFAYTTDEVRARAISLTAWNGSEHAEADYKAALEKLKREKPDQWLKTAKMFKHPNQFVGSTGRKRKQRIYDTITIYMNRVAQEARRDNELKRGIKGGSEPFPVNNWEDLEREIGGYSDLRREYNSAYI